MRMAQMISREVERYFQNVQAANRERGIGAETEDDKRARRVGYNRARRQIEHEFDRVDAEDREGSEHGR